MIDEFQKLNYFNHNNIDFYDKSQELILSYYIPKELETVPPFIQCLTDFDSMKAYLFKQKFFKQDFSTKMNADYFREICNVSSISEELFYYNQPKNTCPMIDQNIDEIKEEYQNKIDKLNKEVEELKEDIIHLNNQAEEAIQNAEDDDSGLIEEINNTLESSLEEINDAIYGLECEIGNYEDDMNEKEDELESMRTSCDETRSNGLYNRELFFNYIEHLTISRGQVVAEYCYLDEIKEEQYCESSQYDSSLYSIPHDNLQLIESWASQWTEKQHLDAIFSEFDFVLEYELMKKSFDIKNLLKVLISKLIPIQKQLLII